MNDYRIFIGAFPGGDLADRIQAVRVRHDAKTARITNPTRPVRRKAAGAR